MMITRKPVEPVEIPERLELISPRTCAESARLLRLLVQITDLRQADLARIFNMQRVDLNRAYHGTAALPARCSPALLALVELAYKRYQAERRLSAIGEGTN